MASAFNAYKFQGKQIKPIGIPQIDWSHPLTQGLISYTFDTGLGFYIDLCPGVASGGRGVPVAGSVLTGTPYGQGSFYGTTTGPYLNMPVNTRVNTTISATGAIWSTACGFYSTLASSTIFPAIYGINGTSQCFQFYNGDTNTSGYFYIGSTSNGPFTTPTQTNNFNTWVMSGTATAAQTMYANGKSIGTGAVSMVISTTNAVAMFNTDTSGAPGSDFGTSSVMFYGAMWNRTLTASEALQLHLDPYCFLLPAEPEWSALFLAGQLPFAPYPQAQLAEIWLPPDQYPLWEASISRPGPVHIPPPERIQKIQEYLTWIPPDPYPQIQSTDDTLPPPPPGPAQLPHKFDIQAPTFTTWLLPDQLPQAQIHSPQAPRQNPFRQDTQILGQAWIPPDQPVPSRPPHPPPGPVQNPFIRDIQAQASFLWIIPDQPPQLGPKIQPIVVYPKPFDVQAYLSLNWIIPDQPPQSRGPYPPPGPVQNPFVRDQQAQLSTLWLPPDLPVQRVVPSPLVPPQAPFTFNYQAYISLLWIIPDQLPQARASAPPAGPVRPPFKYDLQVQASLLWITPDQLPQSGARAPLVQAKQPWPFAIDVGDIAAVYQAWLTPPDQLPQGKPTPQPPVVVTGTFDHPFIVTPGQLMTRMFG